MRAPYISVVVPVYNEEESLPTLTKRLIATLQSTKDSFEIIFTNDGSTDRSLQVLKDLHTQYPQHIRVIDFCGNFGQHMAIMAAFEKCRGEVIINLDADLQNPPEEIPKLLEKVKQGHDVVGSYRLKRRDHILRHIGSRFANKMRKLITNVSISDQGCMFRAYTRPIVDKIISGGEYTTFIPILAWKFAENPCEIGLRHDARALGESKYSWYHLLRVSIDLATSFSLIPIQFFTIFGILTSFSSFLLFFYLVLRRLIVGPEAQGVFTLIAALIFLVGVAIMGIGIVGEYVGRTYQSVARKQRYVIRSIIEQETLD